MAALPRPVPAYGLYGTSDLPGQDAFFHCETIALRSERHDWEISPHVHTALSQMLFIASGKVDLRLGESERALAGPLLVCAPCGTVHGFRFSADVIGFVVTVSQDFLDGLSRQDALRLRLARPALHTPSNDMARKLAEIGGQLVDAERERFDPGVHRLHRALAEAWLRTASRPAADPRPERSTIAQRFQALVEANFREHRPLGFYAGRLGCTVRTLSRRTDEAFGMSPLQLVNRRLLFEARRLLRFTNARCGDVAAELGFEDPAYFSRFYRRMTGQAPSAEKRRGPR